MSVLDKLRATEVTPRTALLSIAILVLAAAGVLAVVVKLMNGPSSAAAVPERPDAPVPTASAPAPATNHGKFAAMPAGKPDYAVIVKRNLFRSTEKIAAVILVPPPVLPTTPPVLPKSSVPPYTPFGNAAPATPAPPSLAYTGVVEVGGETYALIEQLESHDAQYVRKGGTAFDCTVTDIAPRAVTLEYVGTTFTLNLGENKTEPEPTPPPAAQPNNGQPGNTPGAVPPGGRPGFGSGMPPNGNGGYQGRARFNRGGYNPGNNAAGGG